MIAWVLALAVGGPAPPDPATLVYYNARMALRDERPTKTLELWLLRNALESETGALSAHDEDFRSAVWVALGALGLCQDGFEPDTAAAGIWPIALHNWFVKNMRRGPAPDRPAPFDAFEIGRQQRFVSLRDVLSVEELRTVRFHRTNCYRMKDVLVHAGLETSADVTKREVQVKVLTVLLEAARWTVSPDVVTGRSTIDARLLDIRLAKVALQERSARRADRRRRRQMKDLGTGTEPPIDVARTEEMVALLSVAADWDADDWLALEPGRRLFLYDWVRRAGMADGATRLEIIDRLVDRQAGDELTTWIAFTGTTAAARAEIWSGARGQRLLALERSTGFRERSSVALRRGVDAVGAGALADALRAFAYALHFAEESVNGEEVRRLSLRWLSFVASRFEVTDELVTMLVEVVPRGDLAKILEDLIWDAALSADRDSFDRTVRAHRGRGALRGRAERLEPLADGDAGRFLTRVRSELVESPHATLRFLRRFLERLEIQDGDVRSNYRRTLLVLGGLLAEQSSELSGGLARNARGLEEHIVALLEGMPNATPDDTMRDRARALSPRTEVYAGSIRLAPSDPLPWPFEVPELRAPSVFDPLPIAPVEWRRDGALVMGWKLGQ